jgi:hypothetical protein
VTTPEDRLRQILQAEADDLIPLGDGLRRIEQRLADRRSLRSRLVPALAIAGVVAIAGAAAITVSVTDDGSLKQPPAHHTTPAPIPTGCTGGLCEEPKPSPSLSTTGVTTSASGIPLWPVTTDAQAADWERGSNTPRWESDPVQVTQHLMDDYLKLPGRAVLFDNSGDVAEVTVSAGGRMVSTVRLVRVGRDPDGPWSVTGAASLVLAVTQPNDGDEVSSPISTAGTVNDVDQSVHLRLMSDRVLGEAFQPAGRDQPWTHALQWTGADWSVAALVANTFNGKGDLSAVSITAVRRTNADAVGLPPPGTTFVAIEDGHVVLADALSGATLRQISYPPNNAVDGSPDEGGSDGVVWVRTVRGCLSSILRAGLARGPAGVTVDAKPVRMLVPSLSHGGRSLGWVQQDCSGGDQTVVVRGPDAQFATVVTVPAGVVELDVRDDGAALVQLADRVVVLPWGAHDLTAATTLVPEQTCKVVAPAWDGQIAVAWQVCPASWQTVRFTAGGAISSRQPAVDVSPGIRRQAIVDGQTLVELSDHRIARLSRPRLVDVPGSSRLSSPDW